MNVGRPPEAGQRFVHWADVAKWVDEDEEFTVSDRGLLWIHRWPLTHFQPTARDAFG